MHPTCLPSLSPLLLPFPLSSAFPTFDQKKRLENEPERRELREEPKQKGARRRARRGAR